MTIKNATIKNCTSNNSRGAIYTEKKITLANTNLLNNKIVGSPYCIADGGGGVIVIYRTSEESIFTNCKIDRCVVDGTVYDPKKQQIQEVLKTVLMVLLLL